MMEDAQKAATVLVQFEDGTQLDTCRQIRPSKLSDYFELSQDLAPGQYLLTWDAMGSIGFDFGIK
jgi:hypothetical protein